MSQRFVVVSQNGRRASRIAWAGRMARVMGSRIAPIATATEYRTHDRLRSLRAAVTRANVANDAHINPTA